MKMAAFSRFCIAPRSGKYNYLVCVCGGGGEGKWNLEQWRDKLRNSNISPKSVLASGLIVGHFRGIEN